jgi:Flp pilus assembly protein TadG
VAERAVGSVKGSGLANMETALHLRKWRRGTALLEMAVVLPLLMLFLFGMMEYGMQFHVLNLMTAAARDAAREVAVRGGTAQQAQTAANAQLSSINAHFTVTVTQPDSSTATNQDVTVHISVPRSDISLGLEFLPSSAGKTLNTSVTMRKESG